MILKEEIVELRSKVEELANIISSLDVVPDNLYDDLQALVCATSAFECLLMQKTDLNFPFVY